MMPASCKRFIEVDFHIVAVSEHSAREKSVRHGIRPTLHLLWAWHLFVLCRAMLRRLR